ncbi:MAG: hypothetical protein ACLTDF_02535 [Coprococcus sp.]
MIFWTNSLFQFICTAGTEEGRRSLAKSIKDPGYDIAMIGKRQEGKGVMKRMIFTCLETLGEETGKRRNIQQTSLKSTSSDDHIPGIFNVFRFVFLTYNCGTFVSRHHEQDKYRMDAVILAVPLFRGCFQALRDRR